MPRASAISFRRMPRGDAAVSRRMSRALRTDWTMSELGIASGTLCCAPAGRDGEARPLAVKGRTMASATNDVILSWRKLYIRRRGNQGWCKVTAKKAQIPHSRGVDDRWRSDIALLLHKRAGAQRSGTKKRRGRGVTRVSRPRPPIIDTTHYTAKT